MSHLTESWRALGISNEWLFAGHGNVYIGYQAATTGRGSRSASWKVHRPGFQTDPDAHWLDYGAKTFTCWSATRGENLNEAKAWASARYGITEWARTPYGSWMDAGYVKRRVAELKAQVKKVTA